MNQTHFGDMLVIGIAAVSKRQLGQVDGVDDGLVFFPHEVSELTPSIKAATVNHIGVGIKLSGTNTLLPTKERIDLLRKKTQTPANNTPPAPIKPLLKFDGNLKNEKQTGLPFALLDYIELVDWTGRMVREDKCGAMHKHTPPILERLAIDTPSWLKNSTAFETHYRKKRKTQTLAATG